jgi:hypothetical protein
VNPNIEFSALRWGSFLTPTYGLKRKTLGGKVILKNGRVWIQMAHGNRLFETPKQASLQVDMNHLETGKITN